MSEENNQEASIGFAHAGDIIEIEFADGVHVIPADVIQTLGGTEKLVLLAPDLKTKTFGEFMKAVDLVRQKQDLNRLQQNVINNHFNRMF